ncbi:Nif3-like dinuclear metal center hexameric protein [Rubrolithibacter danxiaensis]|uniref:Nif3-like dinuclear metal center hexameric protein n=1 Tax=Rubrolithibacter danxiaensis TaxID=3390805 RepID=UPI003BF7B645
MKAKTIKETNGRRQFLLNFSTFVGTSSLLMLPGLSVAEQLFRNRKDYTVKEIIDRILKEIPGAPFKQTVDTLKTGNPNQVVSGIVTTTFATIEVIEKTIKAGANFIIAHEPTFYNHLDETAWLEQNEVFEYKNELLKKHNIAVWRFHDYWHANNPDGILNGFLQSMAWEKLYDPNHPNVITLSPAPLTQIIDRIKAKLSIPHVRVIGDRSQACSRIAFSLGSAGGRSQISLIQKTKPDVLVCGEVQEWETSEFVRDARLAGKDLSLIVLGHAVSEEEGMKELVRWLQPKIPDIKIMHIPAKNPFSWD